MEVSISRLISARPTLYVAITSHGFGHATRTANVVAEVQRQLPDLLPILVTTAPRWLLESYLPGDFIHRQRALDVGVIQPDSLKMDLPATLAQLQEIQTQQDFLIESEANFIEQNRVDLILADIPPLAAALGQATKRPVWMLGNFGWDFIYRDWGDEFRAVADWMAANFAQANRLFRLPFHEPMASFSQIEDVGLIGAEPRFSTAEIQAKLELTVPRERTVLLTFGGLGIDAIPYQNLSQYPDWQFLTTDVQAPTDLPNLRNLKGQGLRPVDLMPGCGQIVSKPGFSTFAEAMQQGLPITTVTRSGFAETQLLLAGLQDYSKHKILALADFFEGDWQFLTQPFTGPRKTEPIARDGKQRIATEVVAYLQKCVSSSPERQETKLDVCYPFGRS